MRKRRPSQPSIDRAGFRDVARSETAAQARSFRPAVTNPSSNAATSGPLGFTLVEVMVAMVIIGIVSAMSVVALADALDRGRQRATVGDMRALAQAIESYAIDNNDPPTSTGDITALIRALEVYSHSLPVADHWGNAYQYTRDAVGNYTLQSFGKDGIDGADVTHDTANEYHRDIVINNGIFVAAPD